MSGAAGYRIHGLTLRSPLHLPHLRPAGAAAAADVEIVAGPVRAPALEGGLRLRNWAGREGRLVLEVVGIGRFAMEDGRRVTVDRAAGGTDADVVSCVLGSCLTAIVLQRGLLPLHAGAVATDGGAVLVAGRSGAGKSTLLSEATQAGWSMLSDDVTVVDAHAPGGLRAHPAFPAMRLWEDALARLGIDPDGLPRVREALAKRYLPVPRFQSEPMPVRAVLWLSRVNGAAITTRALPPAERVPGLMRQIHRKGFLRGLDRSSMALRAATRIAEAVEMTAIGRPASGCPAGAMGAHLEALLAARGLGRTEAS